MKVSYSPIAAELERDLKTLLSSCLATILAKLRPKRCSSMLKSSANARAKLTPAFSLGRPLASSFLLRRIQQKFLTWDLGIPGHMDKGLPIPCNGMQISCVHVCTLTRTQAFFCRECVKLSRDSKGIHDPWF